jgi:nucleotide-binding universal stress UspA family protein
MNEIIVGVDDSLTARDAALQAAELASALNRPLHLVRAMSRGAGQQVRGGTESWLADPITLGEQGLTALAGELGCTTTITHSVVMKDPAKALCEEAARLGASIIVVGNKRVQGAARVLGSIANDVAKQAPCNVFIVHTT